MMSTPYAVQTCLDPQAMRAHLQRAFIRHGDTHTRVTEVRLAQARRSASRERDPHPLRLVYDVACCDNANGHISRTRLHGKLYRHGASAQAAGDVGTLHVDELDLLLWRWPHDRGLPQLAALLDTSATQPWCGRPASQVTALQHTPEQRATLRYDGIHGMDGARHDDGAPRTLYAKTFADDSAAALLQRFDWLWALAQRDPSAPLVAEPLGHDAATRTLWQAAAPGHPLRTALDAGHADMHLAALARALAAVHEAPLALAGPVPHDASHWLLEVNRRARKIARAVPALQDRAHGLAQLLARTAASLPPAPDALIHGDLHLDQIGLAAGRIVLFDFDEFALGDPLEDIASLAVRLAAMAHGDALATAWLRASARAAPHHHDPLRLHWHLTVQQLLQASRAFVFQVPDWPLEVTRRLARAERWATPLLALERVA